MMVNNDTIVAQATAPGRGGVGIVRVSGSHAYSIALDLSQLTQLIPRQAYYTPFINQQQEIIDQGILLYFKAPHSFTGEDVVEFQAHGAPIVLDWLIEACLAKGARLATPGEFSQRAYLNNKMDLIQAEAIADLIEAHSSTAARMAIRSLQGDFSHLINQLNEQLIHLRLYVEAAIDFPDEELDLLAEGHVVEQLNDLIQTLDKIRHSATQGAMVREGLSIVIAGKPNAGKSTLINQLAKREVAIVSNIAGTTRDILREQVMLDELAVQLIDTAGLRDTTDDPIENEGIKRAWNEVSQADCVLMMIDLTDHSATPCLSETLKSHLPLNIPVIKIYNKIDQFNETPFVKEDEVYLSAKCGIGLNLLITAIKSAVGFQPVEGQFLARRRHLEALKRANDYLLIGQHQLTHHKACELLAEDLRLAHLALGEITGEFKADDLLGKIFSNFCIGK